VISLLFPTTSAPQRPDANCYWLHVVTRCKQAEGPRLMQIADRAQLEWDEIQKIHHYALRLAALGAKA
jgi:hypothetical protein